MCSPSRLASAVSLGLRLNVQASMPVLWHASRHAFAWLHAAPLPGLPGSSDVSFPQAPGVGISKDEEADSIAKRTNHDTFALVGTHLPATVHHSHNPIEGLAKISGVNNLHPRVKGISRKFILRAVNREIVRRLARRATIGIPILGAYFVCRVLWKDSHSFVAQWRQGDKAVAALFGLAVAFELIDLASQLVFIHSVYTQNYGSLALPTMTSMMRFGFSSDIASMFGFAAMPELVNLLPPPDRVSMYSSGASLMCGLLAEGLAGLHQEELEQQQQQL